MYECGVGRSQNNNVHGFRRGVVVSGLGRGEGGSGKGFRKGGCAKLQGGDT